MFIRTENESRRYFTLSVVCFSYFSIFISFDQTNWSNSIIEYGIGRGTFLSLFLCVCVSNSEAADVLVVLVVVPVV